MWYIAEQENDQMSLNGDLMRNITQKRKEFQCIQPLSKYCRQTPKKTDNNSCQKEIRCRALVGRRCSHRRMPVDSSSDAVIFTVDPKELGWLCN
jgi:hypothetical protein